MEKLNEILESLKRALKDFNLKSIYQFMPDEPKKPPLKERYPTPLMETPAEKLYRVAYQNLGKDLNEDFNQLGCAITIFNLLKLAGIPLEVQYPASTLSLNYALAHSPKFQLVDEPSLGCIVMFATGTQPSTSRLTHGHVFIQGKTHLISNNSIKGVLDANWTLSEALKFFSEYGGFPVSYYKPI